MTMMTIINTLGFVAATAVALAVLPRPSGPAGQGHASSGYTHGRQPGWQYSDIPKKIFQSISRKTAAEYFKESNVRQNGKEKQFWSNIQILRLISAYAIVYIHLDFIFRAIHAAPALLDALRFGTDLFVVVAGFLSAHVLGSSRKPALAYLGGRLIRIVPLYFIFTILAFFIQNYGMTNHPNSAAELLKSLAFFPYGPFPVLYPTWTLEIIIEFSVILSVFQLASRDYGVYLASAFVVLLAATGKLLDFTNPVLQFYTNPILIDFAFGVLLFKLVASGILFSMPRRVAIPLGFSVIALCVTAIILHPIYWPQVPRLVALGIPASGLLAGAVIIESFGISANSKLVNFLAKCSFAIYLCHWFVNIVSEKIVSETHGSLPMSVMLLAVTPLVVTAVAILTYLYVEAPATKYLTHHFAGGSGTR